MEGGCGVCGLIKASGARFDRRFVLVLGVVFVSVEIIFASVMISYTRSFSGTWFWILPRFDV